MIKRMLQVGLILAGSITTPSWANIMVGAVDVGSVDSLLGVNALLGNPTDELNWVNSILNPDTTLGVKISNIGVTQANSPDTNVYAFDLSPYSPDYFLVKNATAVALYKNLDDLMWGVINADDLNTAVAGLGNICPGNKPCKFNLGDDTVISHITMFGEGAGVPEPGVLGLLGMGLIGIVLGRRRVRT